LGKQLGTKAEDREIVVAILTLAAFLLRPWACSSRLIPGAGLPLLRCPVWILLFEAQLSSFQPVVFPVRYPAHLEPQR